MTRIIIHIEGGVIQGIRADSTDINIDILDEDEKEFLDFTGKDYEELQKEYEALPYSGF